MLISFIGAPASGKTTVAALVFADLKEAGVNVEFVPEQARVYIAEKRLRWKKRDLAYPPLEGFSLDDGDQIEIMRRQINAENVFFEAYPETVIVTDSSPLNALLYMSENCRKTNPFVTTAILRSMLMADVNPYFYAGIPDTANPYVEDPGRAHGFYESKRLEATLGDVVVPHVPSPMKVLFGTAHHRAFQVLQTVWSLLDARVQT